MPKIESFFEERQSPNGETVTVPKTNITDLLDKDTLLSIGRDVIEGMTSDEGTMHDWNKGVERGLKLAENDSSTKDTPFPNAANYKSPVLMGAALKWSDRASTELLRGDDIVKPKNIGDDPDEAKAKRGERVAGYMNYNLNIEMEEWREEHDKLLYDIPYSGSVFKKVFFDPLLGRPVSNLVVYPNFVVNNCVSSIDRLRRFTEKFTRTLNEVEERKRKKIWREIDLNPDEEDPDLNQDFVEQYGWADLDDDGYDEPYIFVVHVATSTVVRVLARYELDDVEKDGQITRIKPLKNIIKYGFIRDPSGGFLDVGYGHMLGAMTEGINTTTNQLIDSGKFANMQGGFTAKGFRRRKGQVKAIPGVFHSTDMSPNELASSIFPYQFKEPSHVLFQLMQFMIAGAQELSASADLTSALGANAPATTTLALVQEQQLSAGAIILRVYRSMAQEFGVLYRLLGRFGDPEQYLEVLDDQEASFEQDFEQERLDFVPVANPEVSSRIQRIQQATAELQNLQAVMAVGGDPRPIVKNFYEALGTDDINEIFPELGPVEQLRELLAKSPEVVEIITQEQARNQALMDAQLQAQEREEARQEFELQLKSDEIERKDKQTEADIILALEKAESEDVKNQVDNYTKLAGAVNGNNQSGPPRVEGQ
jgi:hypothetical protein